MTTAEKLTTASQRPRLVYICDWLPPDFGAVGQYSQRFARERAHAGEDVTLVGLSSASRSIEHEATGQGHLTTIRLKARLYDRSRLFQRTLWTFVTNFRLLWHARKPLRHADEILFTGSPPFMLHFLAPLNIILRKKLVYRITDFYPECLMVAKRDVEGDEKTRMPLGLRFVYRLTIFWRMRVTQFEVLGEDQRYRLLDIGIPSERIQLKRDISPVQITSETEPLDRPRKLDGYVVLLYSGNFGVAHDHETFIEAYKLHHREGSGRVALWLNATGRKADLVEREIRVAGLPIVRTQPVTMNKLARLLVTPDAHLITLRDTFVGYVLPSKVYGCIESRRSVLYIGSDKSDVHLLCRDEIEANAYSHTAVGNAREVGQALENIADRARGRGRDVHCSTNSIHR